MHMHMDASQGALCVHTYPRSSGSQPVQGEEPVRFGSVRFRLGFGFSFSFRFQFAQPSPPIYLLACWALHPYVRSATTHPRSNQLSPSASSKPVRLIQLIKLPSVPWGALARVDGYPPLLHLSIVEGLGLAVPCFLALRLPVWHSLKSYISICC